MEDIFEVRQSRAKMTLALAGCIAFVVAGWWLKDEPGDKARMAGWLSVVFFGALIPIGLAQIFNPAGISADRQGLSFRSPLRHGRWSWHEVEGFTLWRHRGTSIVYLHLLESGRMSGLRSAIWPFPAKKVALSSFWTLPPAELVRRLTEMKERYGGDAPSRRADPIVM